MLSLESLDGTTFLNRQVTALDLEGTHPIPLDILLDLVIFKNRDPLSEKLRFLNVRQCAREIFMEEEVERLRRYVDTVVSDYDAYGVEMRT